MSIVYSDYTFNKYFLYVYFFFSSRRRHTRFTSDWSSDVCSSDLTVPKQAWMSFLCVGGFAQSPAIFYILFVPLYWFGFSGQTFLYAISIVIMLLQFAAMILATRSVFVLQALWKTIIIVAVSYIPFIVGQWIISRVEIG